jgi:DNA-directed RNA polymerase specialized sigma24 family protein
MALQHARCERTRLPPDVDIKARALALIFQMAEVLTARNAGRRQKTSELLPEEAEPDPLYEEDEGEFWKSHVLDYPRNEEVFSGAVDRSREDVAGDDELVGLLDPRERQARLMHEVHGVSLQEIASAVGIPLTEAQRLLASARNRLRAQVKTVR